MGFVNYICDGIRSGLNSLFTANLGGASVINILLLLAVLTYIVVFIVLLIRKSGSYIGKLNKALNNANNFLGDADCVNEDNLEAFNSKVIEKFNDNVKNGWSDFILAQYDYPSKYITKADCIDAPAVKSRKRIPLAVFSFIVTMFAAVTALILGAGNATLGMIVFYVGLPMSVAFILFFILKLSYNKADIKVASKFLRFQELMDIKVELQNDMTVAPVVIPDPVVLPVNPIVVPIAEEDTKVIKKKVKKEAKPVVIVEEVPAEPVTEDEYASKGIKEKTKVELILKKIDALCSASDASVETLQKIALVTRKVRDTDKSITELERSQLQDGLKRLVNAIKIKKI